MTDPEKIAEAALHGDFSRRVVVETGNEPWQPSPSGEVLRKRLHRVGLPESGQVTSIVRYQPASSFHAHDHPEGEEILVLEGVFQDEHGDWPAGTYLLNPEGFRHQPFSKAGCLLFVKLRQYDGEGRVHVAVQTRELGWEPDPRDGIECKTLYAESGFPDAMRLERWTAGAAPESVSYPGGAELLVLAGELRDEHGRYGSLTWLRLPPGATHEPRSPEGCELYVKTGALPHLRSEPA
jgi:anti-sigma factor ChrR (cupin superfamily)